MEAHCCYWWQCQDSKSGLSQPVTQVLAVMQNPGSSTLAPKVGWETLKCHLHKGWGPTTGGRRKVRVVTGAPSYSTHVRSGGKAHRKLQRHNHLLAPTALEALYIRGAFVLQIRSFFEHCSKSRWPPRPLRFEHCGANFFWWIF